MAVQPQQDDRLGAFETAREAFWVIALAVIVGFAFFLVLGAFTIGDVVPVAIGIGVLIVLWIGHAVNERRHAGELGQSRTLRRIRERRGF